MVGIRLYARVRSELIGVRGVASRVGCFGLC